MTPRQKLVLTLLLAAQFMLAVDFSILNVALPAIGEGLRFSVDDLQWVATGFALPAAGLTLLFGRVADLFGRRRLFLIGLGLLVLSSLLGGIAASSTVLLVARILQGVATAIALPAGLALLTTSFAQGPMRRKALGLNAALLSGGFTAGALFGGLLTDLLSWRWAFLINVPVALAIMILTPLALTESRGERVPLDVPGAIAVTGGLLALTYGITTAGAQGWSEPFALIAIASGVTLLVTFWAIEKRSPNPLVPVSLLSRRATSWGNFAGLLAFATATAMVFLMTLYLQDVLGYSALVTGLIFGITGGAGVLGGILAPKIISRLGSYGALVGGFLAQAASTALLLFTDHSSHGIVLVLVALSAGLFVNLTVIVGFMVTATSEVSDSEQGLATGIASMSQQIGITVGIPIFSAIASSSGPGESSETLLSGIHLATLVNIGVTVAIAGLLAWFVRPRKTVSKRDSIDLEHPDALTSCVPAGISI
ncbi:MAG: MFS transporter [Corynebacteriales bacterium]|nr:MFS transporter [Mycobacteriales bacterium]